MTPVAGVLNTAATPAAAPAVSSRRASSRRKKRPRRSWTKRPTEEPAYSDGPSRPTAPPEPMVATPASSLAGRNRKPMVGWRSWNARTYSSEVEPDVPPPTVRSTSLEATIPTTGASASTARCCSRTRSSTRCSANVSKPATTRATITPVAAEAASRRGLRAWRRVRVSGRIRYLASMVSGMVDKRHDISERLSAIADELADLALESLRDSVEAGATRASPEEKRLTRARRAVEKAAHLLRSDLSPPA